VLVHAAGLGGGATLVARLTLPEHTPPAALPVAPPAPLEDTFEIELPPMRATTSVNPAAPSSSSQAAAPPQTGGVEVPQLDQNTRGRGGEATGQPALNLADHNDGLLLSKDLLSRLDRSQVQRLQTALDRASLEDRRATWKPMELTFLASGRGSRQERRPVADADPSRGERLAASPSQPGGTPGGPVRPPGEGEALRPPGTVLAGGPRASAGRGVPDGAEGNDHREGAEVAFARPSVTEGRPAIPASVVDRPRDNADSEQEVASTVQALLHASPFGGRPGEGRGGEEGPGQPGAGGTQGPGASSRAAGKGAGPSREASPADPAIGAYTRLVFGRVNTLWGVAFPKDKAAQGRQRVVNVRLSRTSGIPEFDRIVERAVLRASPFPPMPPAFGSAKAWRISFDAKNPAVR
jgi:hypothetical protein